METSGLVFIILIGSILGMVRYKAGIKLIKNYQDKKNLRNLKIYEISITPFKT